MKKLKEIINALTQLLEMAAFFLMTINITTVVVRLFWG